MSTMYYNNYVLDTKHKPNKFGVYANEMTAQARIRQVILGRKPTESAITKNAMKLINVNAAKIYKRMDSRQYEPYCKLDIKKLYAIATGLLQLTYAERTAFLDNFKKTYHLSNILCKKNGEKVL